MSCSEGPDQSVVVRCRVVNEDAQEPNESQNQDDREAEVLCFQWRETRENMGD